MIFSSNLGTTILSVHAADLEIHAAKSLQCISFLGAGEPASCHYGWYPSIYLLNQLDEIVRKIYLFVL